MSRFFRRGVSEIEFVAAIVAIATPTKAELDLGVALTPAVAGISGFSINNSPITTPDLETSFDSQIDGPDTSGDSSINFYDDDADAVIRAAVAKGTAGFIALYPYGKVATKRVEIWPAKSTGVNDEWSLDATAAQFQVGFAITGRPNQEGTYPAA